MKLPSFLTTTPGRPVIVVTTDSVRLHYGAAVLSAELNLTPEQQDKFEPRHAEILDAKMAAINDATAAYDNGVYNLKLTRDAVVEKSNLAYEAAKTALMWEFLRPPTTEELAARGKLAPVEVTETGVKETGINWTASPA
jgi:hypothetical protein